MKPVPKDSVEVSVVKAPTIRKHLNRTYIADESVKEAETSKDSGSNVKMLYPKSFVGRRKIGQRKRITVENLMTSMRLVHNVERMDIVVQFEDPNNRQGDGRPAVNVLLACPIMKFLSPSNEDLWFPHEKARIETTWKFHVDKWWVGVNLENLKPAIVIAIDPNDVMWK